MYDLRYRISKIPLIIRKEGEDNPGPNFIVIFNLNLYRIGVKLKIPHDIWYFLITLVTSDFIWYSSLPKKRQKMYSKDNSWKWANNS